MKAAIVFLFLGIWISSAQVSELDRRSVPSYESQVGVVIDVIPIQGSPYFIELYSVGNTMVNGRNVRLLMRHNAYSDQIEMKDKYQKSFNLLKRKDLEAHFNGKTYKMLDYVENGVEKQGYFNPLNEGYVVLCFKPKKIFVQAVKPENGYDEFDPPMYKDDSRYYLQIGSQQPVEISLNKRQILRYFKNDSAKLKQYIDDNNLKLKTEEEVIKLLNYYNSISKKANQINS